MTWETLAAVLVALGSFGGVVYTQRAGARSSDRQADSDERDAALEAWKGLLEPYRLEVEELRSEVAILRRESVNSRAWRHLAVDYMRNLHRAVVRAGGTPPPPPVELEFDPPEVVSG